MTKTILFVHGMFMTGRSWEPLRARFEELGYRCLAPDWPCRDGEPAALREAPDPGLSELSLTDVVAAMRSEIEALDEPPILIGHSMGGLVVQLLAQQGLAARVVAIAPAPPKGVRSFAFSHLRSNAALLWPGYAPIVPTYSWFRYAFANRASEQEARALFESFAVPESRRVGKGPLGDEGAVDVAAVRVPLLFLAGGSDHIIPPALVAKAAELYRAAGAEVAHEVVDGATHTLCSDSSAEEVAGRIERWL